jgi:hypothetical protein
MAARAGEMLMIVLDTVSVAETTELEPPPPLHVSEYVVVEPIAPVLRVPLAPSEPLQPPDAVQAAALLELQVSVDEPPGAITEGATDSVAVGIASMVTVAVAVRPVPPVPLHVSE